MNGKKVFKNLFYGFGGQAIILGLSVVIPRLFLVNYGSEVNGFLNSISQIFVYFSLLEAGVGTASLQALYGPVAHNNREEINSILAATDRYYKKTGFFYFILVVVLSLVYPILIKSPMSFHSMMIIIMLNGMGGVINFFFQGKYKLILQAEGKNYIIQNLTTIVTVLVDILKIVMIWLGCNIIAIQFMYFLLNIAQMIYIIIYIRAKYKWINLKVEPDYISIATKNSAFIHDLSAMIFSNVDVIILTVFADLKVVSVYSMYLMLFSIIKMLITTIWTSVVFLLGQEYNIDKNNYLKMHDCFETYFMTIVFGLYTITYIFILPFMKLYTRGVSDINYIDSYLPILFVMVSILSTARLVSNQAIIFAKHFKETQWRAILEVIINLVVSIIMVNILGIYGVLLGTIAALIYRSNDIIIYSNYKVLNRKPWKTYRRWVINFIMFVGIICVTNYFNVYTDSYITLFMSAALYSVIIMSIYLVIISLFEQESFVLLKSTIESYIKRKKRW